MRCLIQKILLWTTVFFRKKIENRTSQLSSYLYTLRKTGNFVHFLLVFFVKQRLSKIKTYQEMFWRKPQSALEKPLHSTVWKRAPEKEKGNWQNKACQRWFFEAKSVKIFFCFHHNDQNVRIQLQTQRKTSFFCTKHS